MWALNNYRSVKQAPIIIRETKTEIVKDTAESDRLKAENARLAAQLAAAHGKHDDLQKELEQARSQQNSPVASRRPSDANISMAPAAPGLMKLGSGPAAPQAPGILAAPQAPAAPGIPAAPGLMQLGGKNAAPALPGGLLMQLGGKKKQENENAPEEQKIVDKPNLTAEEKAASDQEVLAALISLAETEGSYAKTNSFEDKIYSAFLALDKSKKFNHRLALEEVKTALKNIFERNKPTTHADFKQYYTEKTVKLSIGGAGEIEIAVFDAPTQKYLDFSHSLKIAVTDLFFDKNLIEKLDKKELELLSINYLAGQRENKEIPKDNAKSANRNDAQKNSDRALMATIIDGVKAVAIENKDNKNRITLSEQEQKEQSAKLRIALDWIRINPAFMGFKNMLPNTKEVQIQKNIPGALPEIPLLKLIYQDKISADSIKKELLNHICLDQTGLETFLNHIDQNSPQKVLTKMALLLSKKEEIKEAKKQADTISDGAKKLIEILVQIRKECKEDPSKKFETVLLQKIEENKAIIEPLNRIKYTNLTKMLSSFDRNAGQILSAITVLLGVQESRFLSDNATIKDANKALNIPINIKDTTNTVGFNLEAFNKLVGETPGAIRQLKEFINDIVKAKPSDQLDIYLKFARSFSAETKEGFKSAELQAITKILKDSQDPKSSIIQEALDTMQLQNLYEIKNITDPQIKQLYTTKTEKESTEVANLIHKQIIDSHFCAENNPELKNLKNNLKAAFIKTLPLAYNKVLTESYEKARKEHEKI